MPDNHTKAGSVSIRYGARRLVPTDDTWVAPQWFQGMTLFTRSTGRSNNQAERPDRGSRRGRGVQPLPRTRRGEARKVGESAVSTRVAAVRSDTVADAADHGLSRSAARAALVRFCAAGFVAYCSYSICRAPLLPLFARELGAGPSLIGLGRFHHVQFHWILQIECAATSPRAAGLLSKSHRRHFDRNSRGVRLLRALSRPSVALRR